MGWGEEVSAGDGQKVWAALHSLAPMLISRRGNQLSGCIPLWGFTGVGLAPARLTFSFAKTCRTGGTSFSLSDQRRDMEKKVVLRDGSQQPAWLC